MVRQLSKVYRDYYLDAGLRGLGGQGEYRTRRRSGLLRKRVWWRTIQGLCASLLGFILETYS